MATLAELEVETSTCVRCPLASGRTNVVFGVGNPAASLMLVGEGPGREEDLAGEPFVGRSGQLLDQLVWQEVGLGRGDCYIANVVKCRPPGNRDPRPEEVETCRPYLDTQITLIDPTVIVTLGNFASRLILDTAEGITRLRGRTYPLEGRMVVPTYHPAAALRSGGDVLARMRADLVRAKEALVEPKEPLGGRP